MKNTIGLVLVGLTGALFSVGLALGGMLQADKVIGFLDFFGMWDPSLALVMGGAILAHLVTWRLVTGRATPVFGLEYMIPRRTDIDVPLVAGAALFGIGWGLGGYCPGPGLTSSVSGTAAPLTFVAAMLVGMGAFHLVRRLTSSTSSQVVASEGLPSAK